MADLNNAQGAGVRLRRERSAERGQKLVETPNSDTRNPTDQVLRFTFFHLASRCGEMIFTAGFVASLTLSPFFQ